jgi:hypothetical protein
VSLVKVLFESRLFFPIVLKQQLTVLDFISYCGGSLGLFLGFSLVSAVELLYFFTLRAICQRKISRKVFPFSQADNQEKDIFLEVMENSSIHGCNHAIAKNRHFLEKFV